MGPYTITPPVEKKGEGGPYTITPPVEKKGGGEEGEIFGHVDFTFFYARTQNDTHATRFEIIPGLLGVDRRRAIRLRRDHVLRVEGRRENHRRRHRRGAWRRLHTEDVQSRRQQDYRELV